MSPTSYQTAPPRIGMVAYCSGVIKFSDQIVYDSVMSQPMPPPIGAPKSKSPLFWILLVVGIVVVLGVGVVSIGGYLLYRRASSVVGADLLDDTAVVGGSQLSGHRLLHVEALAEDEGLGSGRRGQRPTAAVPDPAPAA